MAIGYFITGTDTECGKTEITLGLMAMFQRQGYTVLGMKPIASGAVKGEVGLRNEDALRIQHQASWLIDYEQVNPYAFEPPVAPHIAAEYVEQDISFDVIKGAYRSLADQADTVLVEGVGGWRVPLGENGSVSDLAADLSLPVILVVGMKLGCINHALLTAEAIQERGLNLAGWVANEIDPDMLEAEANLLTLRKLIKAPFMGFVPHMPHISADDIAAKLHL